MNADNWNDERIHAYVDGELDAFTAARLEAACRLDATLHARVERQRQLRLQLQADFDAVLAEPVPARLLAAAKGPHTASVTPISAVRPRARIQPLWLGALAASLVIGLAIGWLAPRDAGLPLANGGDGLVATGYLDNALSHALSSGGHAGSLAHVVLSFQSGDGRYCRGFSLASGAAGLACQTGQGWRVEALGLLPATPAGQEYRQAGSTLSPAVLAAIGELQAGDTLDAEQEEKAIIAGWRAPGRPEK